MQSDLVLPLSIFNFQHEITVSCRGTLAQQFSAINCKVERARQFKALVQSDFQGCIVYWQKPNVLVIGRFDDIGDYFPNW